MADIEQRRIRDFSPDSVTFPGESNFSSSLFSSASASVDSCSFASFDALVLDHDSDHPLHLAGLEISTGPNSDPNKPNLYKNSTCINKKAEKVKAQKYDYYSKEVYEPNEAVDSARSSFSQALKECQEQRSRSAALFRKEDRPRPLSLDLNVYHLTSATSPMFRDMKKGSITIRRSGTALSPGTPNYQNSSVTTQNGWSSERVPLPNSFNHRSRNASFFPFSNGRTLPSKWEDAERWIISPNVGDGAVRNSFQQPQRRPKSKSGPLGPPGFAYNNSLHSPAVPVFEGGCVGNLMGGSPFSAGVMVPDAFSVCSSLGSSGAAGVFAARVDAYMARSVSLHGCTEMISQSRHSGHQGIGLLPSGEIIDSDKDASTNISHVVPRRDMATQMSPSGSSQSSPISRLSSLTTPSAFPIVELESIHFPKSDVRDVPIYERVSVTRWSKKKRARFPGKVSENLFDWRRKAVVVQSSGWEVSEASKNISKIKREEAKISAWENLQKAKAEAAIRKLEVKLEKKRLSSMDKIINKLRSAQKKAQEMRSSMLTNNARQVSKTSYKVTSFRQTRQISSLSGCFICHAF